VTTDPTAARPGSQTPTGPARPGWRRSHPTMAAVSAAAAGLLIAGGVTAGLALSGAGAGSGSGARHPSPSHPARLSASTCRGPAGTAYVADAGWDGFSAVNTANCAVVQTYNVDDPGVPGDPDDSNYASTDEGIAVHGSHLYFADTGTSTVAVIDTKDLDPKNYNPAEKLIRVGLFPQDLAVTPDGRQLWVADTGPQTSPSWKSDLTVISTGTDKVEATLAVKGAPSQIAFSPDGRYAYVTTSLGLWVYRTSTRQVAYVIAGLGDPESVAVSPTGRSVLVTESQRAAVAVISTRTHAVIRTIKVKRLPWQIVISANGRTAYVADAASNAVSVITTATGRVTRTLSVTDDPDTLALSPNGRELWVGENAGGSVAVLNIVHNTAVGQIELGGGPQEADGYEPTGIVIVKAS
jgi:YVTN family beta-propeller protein